MACSLIGTAPPCGRWPSPREKARALKLLPAPDVDDDEVAALESTGCAAKSYLSARLTRRQSPQARRRAVSLEQKRHARNRRSPHPRREPSPCEALGNRREDEPLHLKLPPIARPAQEAIHAASVQDLEARPVPFAGREPSQSAPPESQRLLQAQGSVARGACHTARDPPAGEPNHHSVDEHVRRVCDEGNPLRSTRPNFNIPNAASLCRTNFQIEHEKMGEVEAMLARRRRDQYAQAHVESRQKAAAWKDRQQRWERISAERSKKEAEEEAARILAAEQAEQEKQRKNRGFRHILDRTEGPRKRKGRKFNSDVHANLPPETQPTPSASSTQSPKLGHARASLLMQASIPETVAESPRYQHTEVMKKKRIVSGEFIGDVSTTLKNRIESAILEFAPHGSVDENKGSGEAFVMPPLGESADQKIIRVRKMKKLKERADKAQKGEEARCALFDEMEHHHRHVFEIAFDANQQRHGGGLDYDGLRRALLDVGLRENSLEELALTTPLIEGYLPKRRATDPPVEHHDHDDSGDCAAEVRKTVNGCNVQKFTIDIVPAVRKILLEHRKALFKAGCETRVKRDWSGAFDTDELIEVAREVWPLDTFAIDDIAEMKEGLRSIFADSGDVVVFPSRIQAFTETQQRHVSVALHKIRHETGIDSETYRCLESEMLVLKQLFEKIDKDGVGQVDTMELKMFLKEVGVMPKDASQSCLNQVRAKVDEYGRVDFKAFVKLLIELRGIMEFDFLKIAHGVDDNFEHYQIDDEFEVAPYIVTEDVTIVLAKAGIAFDTMETKALIRRIVMDGDADGRGRFLLNSVKGIYVSVKNQLQQRELLSEYNLAAEYRYTIIEMREIRGVFGVLDADGSGTLEADEIKEALALLKIDFRRDEYFDVTFKMFDKDETGGLDFPEFMKFLQMVRDEEGAFKKEQHNVSTLADLDKMDLVLLMECFYGRDHDADQAMHEERLLKEACSALKIEPSTSLESELNVTTLQELIDYAKNSQMHQNSLR